MTNQITDTKLLENQILGNQITGTPFVYLGDRTEAGWVNTTY